MGDPAPFPHERSDVSLIGLAAGVGTMVAGVVISLAVGALYLATLPTPSNAPDDAARPPIAGPVQETDAPESLSRYRREKGAWLNGEGVDPATGAVHIPIARAMDLLVKERAR